MRHRKTFMLAAALAAFLTTPVSASEIARAAERNKVERASRARVIEAARTPARIPQPCNWWVHFERCDGSVVGLPPEAPKEGLIVTVDTRKNIAYLFQDGQLVSSAPAATGMDKLLEHEGKQWLFRTPRGRHPVLRKIVDPVWTKPDWAFVEEGKPIPAHDAPERKVKGKLGRYALDLGDGILIHGTDQPSSLGKKASHGCIRLGDSMLEKLFVQAAVGTEVWIF